MFHVFVGHHVDGGMRYAQALVGMHELKLMG